MQQVGVGGNGRGSFLPLCDWASNFAEMGDARALLLFRILVPYSQTGTTARNGGGEELGLGRAKQRERSRTKARKKKKKKKKRSCLPSSFCLLLSPQSREAQVWVE